MYRVRGLRLTQISEAQLAADKNFYLWLAVEKMHAFAVFTEKKLRPYGCSGKNFTAAGNCTSTNIEIHSKIIEIYIFEIKF